MSRQSTEYEIRLKDNFSRTLDQMENRLNRFERRLKDVNKTAQGFGRGSGGGGSGGGSGKSGGGFMHSFGGGFAGMFKGMVAYQAFSKTLGMIVDTTKAVVTLGGELEMVRTSFNAMLGSVSKGTSAVNQMRSFAVATPYSQVEVLDSTKQMLAYGFEMGNMTDNMRMLGDVASGLNLRLDDMVFVYGTLRSQGRAYARDLYQFAHRGIPIYDALTKTMGVSRGELKDLVKEGKVGFNEVEKAFKYMTREGSMFGGLMEAKSKTFLGRWERFTDKLKVIGGNIGEGTINPMLGKFVDWISSKLPQIGSPLEVLRQEGVNFWKKDSGREALLATYDSLKELEQQGKLTGDGQIELRKTFEDLVRIMPSAVTAWDSYGKALGFSTDKARELLTLTREQRYEEAKKAKEEHKKNLSDAQWRVDLMTESLRTGNDLTRRTSEGKWYHRFKTLLPDFDKNRQMTTREIEEMTARLEMAQADLQSEYLSKMPFRTDPFGQHIGLSTLPRQFHAAYFDEFNSRRKAGMQIDDETNSGGGTSGLEKIQAQTRNIHVNIKQVVGEVTFEQYEKNENDLVKLVSKALVAAVNDVNIAYA